MTGAPDPKTTFAAYGSTKMLSLPWERQVPGAPDPGNRSGGVEVREISHWGEAEWGAVVSGQDDFELPWLSTRDLLTRPANPFIMGR